MSAAVRAFALFMYALGFVARVVPIFDARRMFWQFPTEDGYLMLTIARNLAMGKGMSTSDGLIPTNGTQPLFTFVQALGFVLTDNDRAGGVRFTLIVSVFVAMAGAFAVERLARIALAERSWGADAARVSGALWFASPFIVNHSMNCLETGLCTILSVCSVGYFLSMVQSGLQRKEAEAQKPQIKAALTLGAWLGLTFWARIDAVFLIGVLTLGNLLFAYAQPGRPLRARLMESIASGSLSVVIASPWLIYNKLSFGHFTPISGISQGMRRLGGNLDGVPSKLVEYATMVVPVPHVVEREPWVLVVTTLLFVVYVAVVIALWPRMKRIERIALCAAGAHALALVTYYGVFFGAHYFLSRYLAPISGYTVILTPAVIVAIAAWLSQRNAPLGKALPHLSAAVAMLLCVALSARTYLNGTDHMHIQVWRWVEANVPEDAWLAAVQTGTVGYFHDRTVNLDGKVNPEALAAHTADRIQEYVVEKRLGPEGAQVEYMADWFGIHEWTSFPPIGNNFDVVVADESKNLSALIRKTVKR